MPSERDPRITVRLTEELYAALRARAAEEGLKPAHVARRALEAALLPKESVPLPRVARRKWA